jgi:hypothetical protein
MNEQLYLKRVKTHDSNITEKPVTLNIALISVAMASQGVQTPSGSVPTTQSQEIIAPAASVRCSHYSRQLPPTPPVAGVSITTMMRHFS